MTNANLISALRNMVDDIENLGAAPMTVDITVLRQAISALIPPEGYVLVPTLLPEKMLDALYCAEGDMCDDDMQKLWQQLLAARPEVK